MNGQQLLPEIVMSGIIAVAFFLFKYLLYKKDQLDDVRFKSLKESIDCFGTKNRVEHEKIEKVLFSHAHVARCALKDCEVKIEDVTVHP